MARCQEELRISFGIDQRNRPVEEPDGGLRLSRIDGSNCFVNQCTGKRLVITDLAVDASCFVSERHGFGELPLERAQRSPVLNNVCPQQRIACSLSTMEPSRGERLLRLRQA